MQVILIVTSSIQVLLERRVLSSVFLSSRSMNSFFLKSVLYAALPYCCFASHCVCFAPLASVLDLLGNLITFLDNLQLLHLKSFICQMS